MKRFLSILLCVVLAVSLFPVQSFADDGYYDDIRFGRYEQEFDNVNECPEPIEWTLVEKSEDGSRGLLVAYCVLDVQQCNNVNGYSWEHSSIRKWLNDTFYNQAFTDAEKAVILTTTVKNDASQHVSGWETSAGGYTQDKVFLLSAAEYTRYFGKHDEFPYTDYAMQVGNTKKDNGPFWLRSPGKKAGQGCIVKNGALESQAVNKPAGVCPAIWVDLSADWSNLPYERMQAALDMFDAEEYAKAFTVFDELGNYNYCAAFAGLCLIREAFLTEDDEARIQLLEEFQTYCYEKNLKDDDSPDIPMLYYEAFYSLCDAYYEAANTAQSKGNYDRAIELYRRLGNYDDAISRLLQCYEAVGINYAFIDVIPVNAGSKGGYAETKAVSAKDPHSGWKLGRFIIAGFTEETSKGVYLKTLGDDITLTFELDQDIFELNSNPKMSIASDPNARDVPFNYNEKDAAFGVGALLIQHEDFRHNKSPIHPYEDYLSACYWGMTNTIMEINEEGTYNVALDYLVKTSGFGGTTNGYRISFPFEVRNGDGIAFLRDAGTTSELQNYSVTENGFKVDLAKSHSVKVHVTRKDININGTALDVREDKPASDGDRFTKTGYYTVEMTNSETGKTVTKYIFVGTQTDLREYLQIDPELGQFVK